MKYYIGIDVGTGSARAGVFDQKGQRLGAASKAIKMNRPQTDFVEQSSQDIWSAVCYSVQQAMAASGVDKEEISGIGFDATCSLVVMDRDFLPLTVSPTNDGFWDVIVWMDHRAINQADRINTTRNKVLDYVGGKISPEMQTPKLLWLKENRPDIWQQRGYFFDLPDWLTWRATGSTSRSTCSCVCKWTYLGHESRWDNDYLGEIGLGDLTDDNAVSIGSDVRPIGGQSGLLSSQAAEDMGLVEGTPVGVSMIDAHAGGIGVLGAQSGDDEPDFEQRIALIGGTSSCHMAVSKESRFVPGIWGPYYSAMLPEMWLNEGGQSTTGALVDHIVFNHAATADLIKQAECEDKTIYQLLNERLLAMAGSEQQIPFLTRHIHVLPYFHGNRSPRANPHLTGMITGLKLSASADDLALLYLATVQAIALGTRHIIDMLNAGGYSIDTIMACGGGTKNPIFLQAHASATGCDVQLAEEEESVLLGSAMLGAVAAGDFDGQITKAMSEMSRTGRSIAPELGETADFYAAKYKVFLELYEDQQKYKAMMS